MKLYPVFVLDNLYFSQNDIEESVQKFITVPVSSELKIWHLWSSRGSSAGMKMIKTALFLP